MRNIAIISIINNITEPYLILCTSDVSIKEPRLLTGHTYNPFHSHYRVVSFAREYRRGRWTEVVLGLTRTNPRPSYKKPIRV